VRLVIARHQLARDEVELALGQLAIESAFWYRVELLNEHFGRAVREMTIEGEPSAWGARIGSSSRGAKNLSAWRKNSDQALSRRAADAAR